MIRVNNSSPGTLVIQAPQSQIDLLLRECHKAGVPLTSSSQAAPTTGDTALNANADKPEPLGLPVWNFESEQQGAAGASVPAQNHSSDKPVPLGLPVWDF